MAIIVDKEKKRRDIALACKSLVVNNCINSLTVSALAKEAGIGKGTIYEYFQNKEEIVFEIVNILMDKHSEKLLKELDRDISTKDKIKIFSQFFYNENDYELREIYKEFISISLMHPNQEMLDYQTRCNERYYALFKSVIENGIEKKELKDESIELCMGIFSMSKGLFIMNQTTNFVADLKMELDKFINEIFKLMELKK